MQVFIKQSPLEILVEHTKINFPSLLRLFLIAREKLCIRIDVYLGLFQRGPIFLKTLRKNLSSKNCAKQIFQTVRFLNYYRTKSDMDHIGPRTV